jgi:hypothetical protein
LKLSEPAVAAARELGFKLLLIFSLVRRGAAQRALFRLEAARASHLEALSLAQTLQPDGPPAFFVEWIGAELAADRALVSDWGEARQFALRSLGARDYTSLYGGLTRWHETEALVRHGEIERAAEDARRFGEQIRDNPRYRIPYHRALAVLAQVRGETEQASSHLREAAMVAEQIGLPGELWPLVATLGEAQKAEEIVRSLAARIDDELVRSDFLREALKKLASMS